MDVSDEEKSQIQKSTEERSARRRKFLSFFPSFLQDNWLSCVVWNKAESRAVESLQRSRFIAVRGMSFHVLCNCPSGPSDEWHVENR